MSRLLLADLPLSIVDHRASAVLELRWEDGIAVRLPHALLRGACRCASCEHMRRHGGAVPDAQGLTLTEIRPVSDQGLNLAFSDGHDRGIYPWAYLRELGTAL